MDPKILYMLMALEAKLRVQTDLLIEIADVITQKDPGAIRNEVTLKTIAEMKRVRNELPELEKIIKDL